MAGKLPWFKFASASWLGDLNLRAASIAARGLWIDLLCLMDSSPKRGYLLLPSGKPMTPEHIARMIGVSPGEVISLIQELEEMEVFSRTDEGIIWSRRMKRDTTERKNNNFRQSKYRDKSNKSNTNSNATCNAVNNGHVTGDKDIDTDTEKDTEKELNTTSAKPRKRGNRAKGIPAAPKIEVDLSNRTWHGITQADLEAWAKAYPAVDITRELAGIIEWLIANPTRLKTKYRPFIVNWLSRSQNRGGDRRSQPNRAQAAPSLALQTDSKATYGLGLRVFGAHTAKPADDINF